MKKTLTLIILLQAAYTLILAQETKTVKIKDLNKSISHKVEVLKSDKSIWHGKYQKFYYKDLVAEGYYKNGKMDSIWVYYDIKGTIMHKYNHSTRELIELNKEHKKHKPSNIYSETNPDSLIKNNVIGAFFLGGEHALLTYLSSVKYPKEAKNKGIEGLVYIRFNILPQGGIENVTVYKSANPMLDYAAKTHVQNSSDFWIGGSENGEPMKTQMIVPVNFRLH
ncbi:MAG: energy transducer TonB [Chitinophagales bacterium]